MATESAARMRANALFKHGQLLASTSADADVGWTKAPNPSGVMGGQTSAALGGRTNESTHAEQYKFARRGWQFAAIRPIATRIAAQTLRLVRQSAVKGRGRGNGKRSLAEWQRAGLPTWVKQVRYPDLEQVAAHRLLDAVNSPNPFMVQWHLMWLTAFSLQATGKAFWWFTESKGEVRIWFVPAHWISPDQEAGVRARWVIRPEGSMQEWKVSGDEVAMFYTPDPGNPLDSMAPLPAASRPILSDDAIHESQLHGFQGGHMPDHAFIIGEQPDADGVKRRPELTENQRKELEARFRQLYGGPRKHGRIILLDALINDVKRLSFAPTEMDYLQSMKLTEREIEKIFGVNPIMLGEIENANRASATVADDVFLMNVVNPILTMMGQVLTAFARVCPFFSGDSVVAYYEDVVAKDPELEQKDWQFAYDRGVVDINDFRIHRLSLPPLPQNGDIARINVTLVDVPIGGARPIAPALPGPGQGVHNSDNQQGDDDAPADDAGDGDKPTGSDDQQDGGKSRLRVFTKAYADVWLKLHTREEDRLAMALNALFREQAAEFADLVRSGSTNARSIILNTRWTDRIVEAATPLLRQSMYVGAGIEDALAKSFDLTGIDLSWMDGSGGRAGQYIESYLSDTLKQPYWADIATGIETELDAHLRRFMGDGMSQSDMADAIHETFEDLSRSRSLRIARTESTGAFNAGAYGSRLDLQPSGLIKGQEWNSILDDRTRGMEPDDKTDHVVMDGQQAGIGEMFNVGGELAPFPGHFSLSAGNRVNCRCFSTTVLLID